jgi:5-formyltetrahydrofolate cyclo-ligase
VNKKSADGSDSIQPASSPCSLSELDADGRLHADPQQARDVGRWRKAQRQRLIDARSALSLDYRAQLSVEIARRIDQVLAQASSVARQRGAHPLVSVYWPIRGEPDLRPWMHALVERGLRVALPLALALGQPLEFREWRPGAKLAHGLWKIPYPADGPAVVPDILIAPLVGFDAACYRLGYGGGFFDRTLAALQRKPLAIGVGYAQAVLPTIYPQSHDIPMDWIVTESSAPGRRVGAA